MLVVEALHALLPGIDVEGVDVLYWCIGCQHDVERLPLVDELLPVSGLFYDHRLFYFWEGAVDSSFLISEKIEVLDRAIVITDRIPDFFAVLPFLLEQFEQALIFDCHFHFGDILHVTV